MRFSFILILFLSFHLKAQTGKQLSLSFLNMMQRNQFDSCYVMLDTSINQKLSSDMLKQVWESIPRYVGEYKGYSDVNYERTDSTENTSIRCDFEKMKLDLKVVHNKYKKIIAVVFLPPKNNKAYQAPSYYDPSKFYETKITVKTGVYELPGILCIPNNIANPPVAILLAGSGPSDKDGTAGPNKVLKDIATGLACNGIASLRYDKRTAKYGMELMKKPETIDINIEVIDDALSAVDLLKKHPVTKDSKVFVIGHSLGAMCEPLVASRSKSVNGIILLAGNARPLEDVLLEQVNYLTALDTSNKAEAQKQIAELEKQIKNVKDPKFLKTASVDQLPLGMHSFYWQSLINYKQTKIAKKIKQPILVLQGERDYQVTMTDFNIWKKELGGDPKNQFRSYAKLNHFFISGEGKCTPVEYDKPGNVEEQVILDMAKWIKDK